MPHSYASAPGLGHAGWNGMAIGALAKASAVLQSEDPTAQRSFPVEGCPPSTYLAASIKVCIMCCLTLFTAAFQSFVAGPPSQLACSTGCDRSMGRVWNTC